MVARTLYVYAYADLAQIKPALNKGWTIRSPERWVAYILRGGWQIPLKNYAKSGT
jgi:hypothetical protein